MKIPNLQEHISLAPYTSFRIGGPARYFVVVKTPEAFQEALRAARTARLPWFILGGGSDILVADHGFDGLVIKSELREIFFNDAHARVRAGSGVRLSVLITQALQHTLQGLEFAIGVPASAGGAVWANLGARGSDMSHVVAAVSVIDLAGQERVFTQPECHFGYRDSIFKREKCAILEVTLQLQKANKERLQQTLQEFSQLRNITQDIASKSAGCIFRNPIEQTDQSAAALIDALGLKGMRVGGAQVSDIHSNFIVNTGNATAEDVVMLISLIKQKVRDEKGIQLMEEIEYVGF